MKTEKYFLPVLDGPIRTAVLVLDQSNTLSLAAAIDPMRAANRKSGKALFEWSFHTATGTSVKLTSGLKIDGSEISTVDDCDLLIVVAGFDLRNHATPRLGASLRRLAKGERCIIAIDGGPWLLAEAGLLDGVIATTHWEDLDQFEQNFPDIKVHRNRYCIDGQFATSGGAAPAIDLMLQLINTRWGGDLARQTASAFIYDPIPEGESQSLASLPPLRRLPKALNIAVKNMAENIEDPLSVPEIATKVGLSPRRLSQIFTQHLGQSPQAHYLQLRLSEAHRLALDTGMQAQEIAAATGFNSQSSLARAFRNAFGCSIRQLRQGSP